MKKIIIIAMLILMVGALAVPVSAQSQADRVYTETVVSRDGSCQVTVHASVTYDEAVASPVFPVPLEAESILLDGSTATVYPAASSQMVSLKDVTRGVAGSFSFTLSYRLPAVVTAKEDGLQMTLQLLSGLPLDIMDLEMKIQLPGDITAKPTFTSSYYQGTAEDLLDVEVDGDTITVEAMQLTKNCETMVMRLAVESSMFPGVDRAARVLNALDMIAAVALLLAAVYYVLTMRPSLPYRAYRTVVPDGIAPGEVGMWLVGGKRDLSMLVVTWARLGYLRIQVEDSGRVLLHKRMEMGNERSSVENRLYKNLFGRRQTVDGTGYHYAQLCRSVMKKKPSTKEVYLPKSGSPVIFRGLCTLCGVVSGSGIAGRFAPHSVFWIVLLALVAGTASVLLQSAGRGLLLRDKLPVWIGLGAGLVWIILGACVGDALWTVMLVLVQLLAGLASAVGGRRTELGQQALMQLMGLRRFMGRSDRKELQRCLKANPSYFHELAPYALALGRDKVFARRFGNLRMPECSYLICGNRQQMTASEWAAQLRAAVKALDARAKRLPFERLTGK